MKTINAISYIPAYIAIDLEADLSLMKKSNLLYTTKMSFIIRNEY